MFPGELNFGFDLKLNCTGRFISHIMTMKKILVSAVFLLSGILLNAQNDEWTLQECIERALEMNISIAQSELDVELADLEKRDAVGNLLPGISASATNAWNTGLTQNVTTGILQTQTTRSFSAGISAGLTLFDGLRNYKQLQRAKLSKLASRYALEQMKDNIALNVANLYLQVLFNKESLKVIQAQHEVTLQQLERSEELVEAGVLPRGDLLEIKAASADELQRIIEAKNAIRISLIALAQTLLIEDYRDFDVQERDYAILGDDILNTPVSEIIAKAKEERYEIRVAKTNKEIAEKDVELAKGAYWPSLTAFFNYNTRASGAGRFITGSLDPDEPYRQIGFVEGTGAAVVAPNMLTQVGSPLPFFEQLRLNDGISYGVQLSIPILNGLSTRNTVRRREIAVKRAELQLTQAELDLEADVYQAFVDAQGAYKSYLAALASLEAQQLAYEYAVARYDVGMINSLDFNEAKFRLENAQSEVIRTKFEYIFNIKVLELYFGVPITDLKF